MSAPTPAPAPAAGPLLEARGLRCTFPQGKGGRGVDAVKGLDLVLEPGDLVGLIGPDGAGKSTTFRMFMGLQKPTGGTLERRIGAHGIGYVPQAFSLSPDLTVEENMRLQAGLYGMKSPEGRIARLLRSVDLDRFRDRLSGALSGGMKQKLALCVALLPEPRLLLLDEPTTGVDPVSRREFWQLLHAVHDEGVAILFSSPYMDEAEYAHRMLLMHEGHVLDEGDMAAFQAKIPGHVFKVTTARRRAVQKALEAMGPLDLFGEGEVIRVRFEDHGKHDPEALQARIAGIPGVEKVQPSEATLEDYFLHALAEAEGETVQEELQHG